MRASRTHARQPASSVGNIACGLTGPTWLRSHHAPGIRQGPCESARCPPLSAPPSLCVEDQSPQSPPCALLTRSVPLRLCLRTAAGGRACLSR